MTTSTPPTPPTMPLPPTAHTPRSRLDPGALRAVVAGLSDDDLYLLAGCVSGAAGQYADALEALDQADLDEDDRERRRSALEIGQDALWALGRRLRVLHSPREDTTGAV